MFRILALILLAHCIILSCDLERIDEITDSQTKFMTTIGQGSNDFPYDVMAEEDGSFIVAGRTQKATGAMDNDVYLAKVDKQGGLVWERSFGNSGDDWAYQVSATPDGGYVFCGLSRDPVSFSDNIFVGKVNSLGNEVWLKTFGAVDSNEIAVGIYPLQNGNFTVGYTQSDAFNFFYSIRFLTLNANGSETGDKLGTNVNNISGMYLAEMVQTENNDYVLAGSAFTGSNAMYIARFDASGNFIWSETYPDPSLQFTVGNDLIEQSNGNLVLAGSTQLSDDRDFLTVTYSGIGMLQQVNPWGGSNDDELLSISPTHDGHIIVLGYSASFSSMNEIYISKRDGTTGSEIWTKHFAESWVFSGAIELCPDNGFIISAGQNAANADIILIKTDANGEFE
jgi:hypothetical protein